MDIHQMIARWGDLYYLIVFAWTFLEGETCVLLSGIAAKKGYIDIRTLLLVAWAGACLGDQLYFAVGRLWGKRLLDRFPRTKPGIGKALVLLQKHSTIFILTFRFFYGIRNVSSFAIGMSDISWARFALLNVVAAGIWAFVFAGAGYLAGTALAGVLDNLSKTLSLAGLAIVAMVAWHLMRRATEKKTTESLGAE